VKELGWISLLLPQKNSSLGFGWPCIWYLALPVPMRAFIGSMLACDACSRPRPPWAGPGKGKGRVTVCIYVNIMSLHDFYCISRLHYVNTSSYLSLHTYIFAYSLYIFIYIYICSLNPSLSLSICTHTHTHIYIYIYIHRERERGRNTYSLHIGPQGLRSGMRDPRAQARGPKYF
jgi:hypothetical protein